MYAAVWDSLILTLQSDLYKSVDKRGAIRLMWIVMLLQPLAVWWNSGFFRPWHHWRLVASSFTECYSIWSTWCFSASLFFCKSAVGFCILFSTNLVSIPTFRFFLPKIVFISLHWEAYFSSLPVLWWAFFKVCKCTVLPHPLSFSMHYSRMDLMKATTLL